MNRTTSWSNAKAFKSNLREDNMCDKCGGNETIEHIFLNCEVYAEIIWEKFRDLIQQCKSNPGVVNLSQEHVIYLKAISALNKEENGETSEIIQELKQLIYRLWLDERHSYDPITITSHIRKCVHQIVKLRKCNSKKVQLCEKQMEEKDRRAT